MGEIVSEDVLDWARDLAAMEKLFAGEPINGPHLPAKVLSFSAGAAYLKAPRRGQKPINVLSRRGAV